MLKKHLIIDVHKHLCECSTPSTSECPCCTWGASEGAAADIAAVPEVTKRAAHPRAARVLMAPVAIGVTGMAATTRRLEGLAADRWGVVNIAVDAEVGCLAITHEAPLLAVVASRSAVPLGQLGKGHLHGVRLIAVVQVHNPRRRS